MHKARMPRLRLPLGLFKSMSPLEANPSSQAGLTEYGPAEHSRAPGAAREESRNGESNSALLSHRDILSQR